MACPPTPDLTRVKAGPNVRRNLLPKPDDTRRLHHYNRGRETFAFGRLTVGHERENQSLFIHRNQAVSEFTWTRS